MTIKHGFYKIGKNGTDDAFLKAKKICKKIQPHAKFFLKSQMRCNFLTTCTQKSTRGEKSQADDH